MLLRIELLQEEKVLFELTFNNCNYQDFKNHFNSFVHQVPYRARFYEIDEKGKKLIADHLL